jgi:tRNA (Thr-GGU) A37 N-methylase
MQTSTTAPTTRAPYRGAVLLVNPGNSDATQELESSARALASHLGMPLYSLPSSVEGSTSAALRELEQATLLPLGAEAESPVSSAATLHDAAQDADRWPLFLLVVDRERISAVQLERKPAERRSTRGAAGKRAEGMGSASSSSSSVVPMKLHSCGTVCIQLASYKRVGSHGFDAQSPLLRACVADVRWQRPTPTASSGAPAVASQPAPRLPGVHVLDATMGLGADAVLLSSFGARVSMVEQEPILALLMMDALRRATQDALMIPSLPPAFGDTISRLTLLLGSSETYLRKDLPSLPPESEVQPHCLYADPFYPDAPPSALSDASAGKQKNAGSGQAKSKKQMELARMLWEHTHIPSATNTPAAIPDEQSASSFFASPSNLALQSLVHAALSLPAQPRVVLKQPSAPFARRLLSQMGFAVRQSYESRDTVFHVMTRGKTSSGDAAVDAQQATNSVEEGTSKQQQKTGKLRTPAQSNKASLKAAGFGAGSKRAFHTVSMLKATTASPARPPASSYNFRPVGHIRSCFPCRFSIPRQGSLASAATAVLTLDAAEALARGFVLEGAKPDDPPSWVQSVQGLEHFSHVWIIFVFHDNLASAADTMEEQGSNDGCTPNDSVPSSSSPAIVRQTARPPRLGGKESVGVFASRSPYRPNAIGMSCVRLERVDIEEQSATTASMPPVGSRVHLHLSGVDLLNGTPVLDIKPVIPYCDTPAEPVRLGWAKEVVPRFPVRIVPHARRQIDAAQSELQNEQRNDRSLPRIHLRDLIEELLSLDPRHAHQQRTHPVQATASQGRQYGFRVLDWNVRYEIQQQGFCVLGIETLQQFEERKREQRASAGK